MQRSRVFEVALEPIVHRAIPLGADIERRRTIEPRQWNVLSWVLIALAILVLIPLAGMLAMMLGMGGMMSGHMAGIANGGMMTGGMMAWSVLWMLIVAALLVVLMVTLFRSVRRV